MREVATDVLNEEVPAFIEFTTDRYGSSQFILGQGRLDGHDDLPDRPSEPTGAIWVIPGGPTGAGAPVAPTLP